MSRGMWMKTCAICGRGFGADAGSQRVWCDNDECRLKHFVQSFQHHVKTHAPTGTKQWPTVREAARRLRWTQKKVIDTIDGCGEGLMMTSYLTTPPEAQADHFIERV